MTNSRESASSFASPGAGQKISSAPTLPEKQSDSGLALNFIRYPRSAITHIQVLL